MKTRLENGTKVNLTTASKEELSNIIYLADAQMDRLRSQKYLATEQFKRRFGENALATVTDINAWRNDRSQEEFDLDVTPDDAA